MIKKLFFVLFLFAALVGAGNRVTNKGAPAGATLVASDNFDAYTHLSALSDQTGWGPVNGYVAIIKPSADGVIEGSVQSAARRTDTFSANQRSVLTTVSVDPGNYRFVSVQVRCQSGTNTRYWFQTDGSNWFLLVGLAGSYASLSSGTHSIAAGDRIALSVTGAGSATRLTAQHYSGGSWADISGATNIDPGSGNYIDGGTPGVGADNGAGSLCTGDYWEGWNL